MNDVMLSFQRAIADKTKVGIRYDSFYEKCEIETILRPYLVVFRSRGWYVIAYSERHREVRTFKLERMLQLRPLGERFKPDGTFNQNDYFGNAWNMVRGTIRYHVEIGFSNKVAGNVEEVAWHPTQRTRRRSDGSLVFEVDGRVVLPFKLLCDPGVDILHRLGRYPGHGDRSYVSGEMDTGLGVGSDLRNQLEEAAVDMRQPILGVP